MALPIVFLHKGNSPYLWFTIRQAKFFNPDSEIILLGDKANRHLKGVSHYLIDDYFTQADIFATYYKHLSTNFYSFELFCFQRWFVLLEFMQKKGLAQCIQLDTDLMVFCNITEQQREFSHAVMTLVKGAGPQTAFINDVDGFAKICNFLLDSYRDLDLFRNLKQWHEEYTRKDAKGGVCDMTVLSFYKREHPRDIISMDSQHGYYDDNFAQSEGFIHQGGRKTIYWEHNLPYVKKLGIAKKVRLFTIHFQGRSKRFIPWYSSQKNWQWLCKMPAYYPRFYGTYLIKGIKKILCKFKLMV